MRAAQPQEERLEVTVVVLLKVDERLKRCEPCTSELQRRRIPIDRDEPSVWQEARQECQAVAAGADGGIHDDRIRTGTQQIEDLLDHDRLMPRG